MPKQGLNPPSTFPLTLLIIARCDFSLVTCPQALLSPGVLATCRQIDEVKLPGYPRPVGVFAYDCDPTLLSAEYYVPQMTHSRPARDEITEVRIQRHRGWGRCLLGRSRLPLLVTTQ